MSKAARESMADRLRRLNARPADPEESRISESRISEARIAESSFAESRPVVVGGVHPGQGGRGDFLKVTVTMDPDDFEAINAEMVRRKRAKERGAQLSGCIREAIRFWRAAGMPRVK